MYKFSINGATVAIVDKPVWIRRQRNGCFGQTDRIKARGVAIDGKPYNLAGYDIGGVATVEYEEVQGGTYLLRQEANIDYLSMMTGIDLPNENDAPGPEPVDEPDNTETEGEE